MNNAAYLSFAEQSRVNYFMRIGVDVLAGNFVLARTEVDFIHPLYMQDVAEVGTHVSAIGNSSVQLECEIWVKGVLCAKSHEVVVWLENQKPTRVPDSLRKAMAELEPEIAKS